MINLNSWKKILKRVLDSERFIHSIGVQKASLELALLYGTDPVKAETAGLLHDFGKQFKTGELLKKAREWGIPVQLVEELSPDLLHGPVGAQVLKRQFGLADTEVIEAISFHTTGKEQMGDLSRIVFLADYIEENRSFPGVQEIRVLSRRDLREALLEALDATIRYVLNRGLPLHPYSVDFRNAILCEKRDKSGGID
ncbi:bis(5'-nucleosyl)-tetraphosphatase (symmetrical) YqeK [Candidatus Contubernalis alkalaceticus]|uniref:bis(5'-nucleosyl)-tetraphosphatase (symmetrical) YqeK n=1 Tax=Candidatus Contubernalis alkaliaceticus TaxID=338645 RepID=UPI0029621A62|nr:bis(5'-nucleosyl)-tetraphosphatase (symmetrical) YqeK [Candidatus Contubernalis alkalaceticus]UNC93947.1 HD domain-containing protein [Candidatus Contubernalis alkalaceticus]